MFPLLNYRFETCGLFGHRSIQSPGECITWYVLILCRIIAVCKCNYYYLCPAHQPLCVSWLSSSVLIWQSAQHYPRGFCTIVCFIVMALSIYAASIGYRVQYLMCTNTCTQLVHYTQQLNKFLYIPSYGYINFTDLCSAIVYSAKCHFYNMYSCSHQSQEQFCKWFGKNS